MEVKPNVMHLMIIDKCENHCRLCCNKLYGIEKIPVATVEELKQVHTVCITGGEPFFSSIDMSTMALEIKSSYSNVKQVYVYTSGAGLAAKAKHISSWLDGINIVPKTHNDWWVLNHLCESFSEVGKFASLKSNRLYVFKDQLEEFEEYKHIAEKLNLKVIHRIWDKKFNTPDDEIFRRLPIFM